MMEIDKIMHEKYQWSALAVKFKNIWKVELILLACEQLN